METTLVQLQAFIFLLLLCLAVSDPDPLQDYCIANRKASTSQQFFINGVPCIDPSFATVSHFTTSALAKPGNTKGTMFGFNVTLTTTTNLPGLNTMGLVMARVDIGPSGLVPPHSHPRASEVTTLLTGAVLVGFVDTSNQLFTQQLRPGDSFVFPKGLIHFIFNLDSASPAFCLSGLSSQNPGVQIASLATFTSNPLIPDEILKIAFKIQGQDVTKIRKSLGG